MKRSRSAKRRSLPVKAATKDAGTRKGRKSDAEALRRLSLRRGVEAQSALVDHHEGVWPLERAVLHRPDRLSYVRKIDQPVGCVFCAANKGDVGFETLKLWSTTNAMVVLNKYPYNSGHLLVLPRQHIGSLNALSDTEYSDLQRLLRLAVRVVEKVYAPVGMNLGLNHGKASGAGIPDHLHWHVIPRWHGDTNFFPIIAETKVLPETLEQSYERLRLGFQRG